MLRICKTLRNEVNWLVLGDWVVLNPSLLRIEGSNFGLIAETVLQLEERNMVGNFR